MDVFL